MGMFVACMDLSQRGANAFYKQAVKWFKDNPKRVDAVTDRGKIRRDYIAEDILKNCYCAKGVKLPPPTKKKTTKKVAKKVAKKKVTKKKTTKKPVKKAKKTAAKKVSKKK